MGRSSAIMDGDLKSLIREKVAETRIIPPLKLEGTGIEDGGLLRASAMAGVCAREEVICSRINKVREEKNKADLMLIFEHGNGLHWVLQNRILPKIGTMRGRWRCMCCGRVYGGGETGEWESPPPDRFVFAQVMRPATCESCGTPMRSDTCVYVEQWFVDSTSRMSCHPDGFLQVRGYDYPGVGEFKSINPRGAWEVRGCPKLDHVVQLQCCLWLTGRTWGKILYWDKAGSGMSTLIEHTLERDEDHIGTIRAFVDQIWEGVGGGPIPEPICAVRDCKRAELCHVVEECFGEAV